MDLEKLYQERCKGKDGKWPNQAAMAEHLPLLRDLVEKIDAQQVIEIGVHTGQSTVAFLVGLQKTGGRLWSCDVELPKEPIRSVLEVNWVEVDVNLRWTFVQGESTHRETIARIPFDADIVFVDGALDNRLTDLLIYDYFTRPGSYILAHDTMRENVLEMVKTFMDLNPNYELITNFENGHGLAVIKC